MKKSLVLLLIIALLITPCLVIFESVSAFPSLNAASMSVARHDLGVAVVDDKIYAIGGDARYGAWPYSGSTVGTNEEYNPATDTWTTKASMPTARSQFAITAYQGKIYCFGGQVTAVEVYDPTTDIWENKTAMPTARWGLQANAVNGKIYLIGGYTRASEFPTNLTEVYDPVTDSWTTAAPIPLSKEPCITAVIDEKIHCIASSSKHLVYDPQTNTWSTAAPSSAGLGYSAVAAATSGVNASKRLYVFGGSFSEETASKPKIYDPATDSWTLGNYLQAHRMGFAVAVVDDVFYVIGGCTRVPDADHFGDTVTLYADNERYLPQGYGTPDPSYVESTPNVTASPQETTALSPPQDGSFAWWWVVGVLAVAIAVVCAVVFVYLRRRSKKS
ncbi:MAG TPA: kelch repeat-containing protein [Candidatus Acidoferrales bacterium]|nr:kelch repeat-containing protein [Candidatus Acidoferrales bacterium]